MNTTRRRRSGAGIGSLEEDEERNHDEIAALQPILHRIPAAREATEPHVLAVDDSLLDRKLIERMLRSSSFKVTVVDSAKRALEVLGLGEKPSHNNNVINVNLIISDYCMPEMTGFDLLKKVKGSSLLREIPVVIVSSEDVPTRISRCLAEGAEEFLLKPLKLSDVRRLGIHIKSDPGSSLLREIPVVIVSSEDVPTRISRCLAEGAEEFLLKPLKLSDVRRLRIHIKSDPVFRSLPRRLINT